MKQGELTADERRWAMFAHGSVVLTLITLPLLGTLGVLATLFIWLLKRNRSPYVAAQALQAFIFQPVVVVLTFLIAYTAGSLAILVLIGALTYGLYAAYSCYHGRDFKYPVLGKLLTPRGV